ncbi:VHS domain-containing protein [Entamoeba marina]
MSICLSDIISDVTSYPSCPPPECKMHRVVCILTKVSAAAIPMKKQLLQKLSQYVKCYTCVKEAKNCLSLLNYIVQHYSPFRSIISDAQTIQTMQSLCDTTNKHDVNNTVKSMVLDITKQWSSEYSEILSVYKKITSCNKASDEIVSKYNNPHQSVLDFIPRVEDFQQHVEDILTGICVDNKDELHLKAVEILKKMDSLRLEYKSYSHCDNVVLHKLMVLLTKQTEINSRLCDSIHQTQLSNSFSCDEREHDTFQIQKLEKLAVGGLRSKRCLLEQPSNKIIRHVKSTPEM